MTAGDRASFVLRTIKDGAVTIHGRVFRPDEQHLAYDGRLDGMRYAFALYYSGGELEPFVSLWGTERAYRSDDDAWPGPECVDGYYHWMWWRTDA